MIIKRLTRKISHIIEEKEYHDRHKNEAFQILKNIEKGNGKTDPNFIKLSDQYAKDIFGWSGYAPWLYVYSAVSGSFKEGWIPDNFYGRKVLNGIKGDYRSIANLKPLSTMLFDKNFFPDIAYYSNNLWTTVNHEVLHPDEVKEYIFKNVEKIVFKRDNSSQGKGIYFFDKNNFDINVIKNLKNGVFQEYITQHTVFENLMPKSVATLRMTTTLDDFGKVQLRSCYLRIGRSQDTHVKSATSIRLPIDISSGQFFKTGFTYDWTSLEKHPDTQVEFLGNVIPNFDKCRSTVISLHSSMPYNRCIGWDIIVDNRDDIKIMEWNGNHNDIKFSEATQGPCFADLGWEKFR